MSSSVDDIFYCIFLHFYRGMPFMHVRMQDSANVEINNPMYLKEEYDYEASEALNGSVSQDIDDVCIKICIISLFKLLPV